MSTDSLFDRMKRTIMDSLSPELASIMNNNGATPPRRRNNSGIANTAMRRGPPFVEHLDDPVIHEDDEVQEAIRRSLMENQRTSPRNNQGNLSASDFEDLLPPHQDLEFPISDADLPYDQFEEPQDPMELAQKEQEEIERAIQASAEEEGRRERQRLREEQDRAYQESLRADAERARRAKEEQMKRIEEEQRHQEELDRQHLEEAMRLSVQLTKEQREKEELRRKSEQFKTEPLWQTNSDAVTQLGIRLPNGQRLTRNFLKSDKLTKVKEFIETRKVEDETLKDVIPAQFDLVQDFPRKVYDNLNLTLEQVGLLKRALISVQEKY
jgi:flagellar biosynthesis GTPase FlhF